MTDRRRDDHRARSARASPRPSAWRSPSGCWRRSSARTSSTTSTFVLCSDGDLMEGVSHEAIALAGHLRLNKLIFLFDDNGISIDGPLTLADSVDQVARFKAAGWNATQHRRAWTRKRDRGSHRRGAEVRPAEPDRLQDDHRLRRAQRRRAPPRRMASRSAPKRLAGAKQERSNGITRPFEIPDDILDRVARGRRARQVGAHAEWKKRFAAKDAKLRGEFERRFARKRPAALAEAFADAEGEDRRRQADARDPQVERAGAGVDRAGDAGADRSAPPT